MNSISPAKNHSQNSSVHVQDQSVWKDKYFSLLEEQEQEQKQSSSSVDILRRGLLSVSLAGDGLDSDLDQKLDLLRTKLKAANDYTALTSLLQNIETDLIRLDTEKFKTHSSQTSVTAEAISLLLKTSLDSTVKTELKIFQKKIKAIEKGKTMPSNFESELLNFLLPLVGELSNDYAEKNPADSLWTRLRKSVSPESNKLTTDANSATPTPTVIADSYEQCNKPADNNQALLSEAKSFLSQLIDYSFGNQALAKLALSISQKIELTEVDQLSQRYPEVLSLLDSSRIQNQKEFLDYLAEIDGALARINTSISNNKNRQQQLSQKASAQRGQLNSGIRQIRKVLDTAEDLEAAKTNTFTHIDKLSNMFEETSQEIENEHKDLCYLAVEQAKQIDELKRRAEELEKQVESSNSKNQVAENIDELTGLGNVNWFLEKLEALLTTIEKPQDSLHLCVGEVNDLSKMNDEFGENAGDKAIELLAQEIDTRKNANDILAYGGDGRFLLLITEKGFDDCSKQIHSLENDIKQLPFKFKGEQVEIAMTYRVTAPTAEESAQSLLEKAGMSLDDAKSGT